MAGPFVHKVSLEITRDMLKPISNNGLDLHIDIPGLSINPIRSYKNIMYYLKPDLKGLSHGADVKNGKYWIIDNIEKEYLRIRKMFSYKETNIDFLNSEFQDAVLYLNHYLCDSMTIGQISGNEFWGSKDNLIDFASEFVTDKKKYQIRPRLKYYKNYDDLIKLTKARIDDTYTTYHKDALKWVNKWHKYIPFYLSVKVSQMIRRAVTYSAHTTALLVYKAHIDIIENGVS